MCELLKHVSNVYNYGIKVDQNKLATWQENMLRISTSIYRSNPVTICYVLLYIEAYDSILILFICHIPTAATVSTYSFFF